MRVRRRRKKTKEVSGSVRKDEENKQSVVKIKAHAKIRQRQLICTKQELRDKTRTGASHLTLVVVQIQMLSVLLLSIPPPPLGRSASLGPPVTRNHLTEQLLHIEPNAVLHQTLLINCLIWSEIFTCCWWGQWRERLTADEGKSPAHSAPGQSSCPAGGGAGRYGRSSRPSFQWLSLLRRQTYITLKSFSLWLCEQSLNISKYHVFLKNNYFLGY